MFALIVRRELREILTSPKFAWTLSVASILILLAFYLGARSFESQQARYQAAVAESLRRLEGLATWIEARPVISLPPSPVACLVQGLSNDIGRNIEVIGRGPVRAEDSRYGQEPLLATFRLLDLQFIFQVVLSLFAIVFAFDAVSGEKEQGTLRLVLANPVPRATLILGKLTGTYLGLTVPLLIPLLAGGALLAVMELPMTAADWLQLALIVAAGMVFLGACVGLAVLVSALTRRAATSMLVLLLIWVMAVLVVPRAALLVAARAVEVPPLDQILSQRARLRAQLWHEDQQELDRFWEENTAQEGQFQQLIGRFNQLLQELSTERQAKLDSLEQRLTEERLNRQAVQRRLGLGLARVSPASAFALAATSLAGTGLGLPDHLHDQARAYQQGFERFQRERSGGQSSGEINMVVRAVSMGEEPENIDPHELPPFQYRHQATQVLIHQALGDLGLLVLFNLLMVSGAFVAFLRYDVR